MVRYILLFLAAMVLVAGCSPSLDVVGHGPFQKRKYRPGWHVDWASMKDTTMPARPSTICSGVVPVAPVPYERELPTADLLLASTVSEGSEPSASKTERTLIRIQPTVVEPRIIPYEPRSATDEAPAEDQPRRWNRMALISGVFLVLSIAVALLTGGGGIFPYLLTFSFLTGLIGLVLAIKHKERGKGIAIAAMAWPVVIIALVIAALNSVW